MSAVPQQEARLSTPDKHGVLSVIRQMQLTGVFVEIGTFGGSFAHDLLNVCHPQKLYCVDPYAMYGEFKDALNSPELERAYADAQRITAPFGERVEFLRMYSEDAAARFADASLDFAYIDGNHAYKYALQDLECWYPKVRDGGLICCDDATDIEDDSARDAEGNVVRVWKRDAKGVPESWGHYGVIKAAHEFTRKHGIQLLLAGSQGFIFKGGNYRVG